MPQSLFEDARRYFADHWQWHLHEETFQQLGDETFICKATTTFNADQGTPEMTFYTLHTLQEEQQCTFDEAPLPSTFDEEAFPVLLDWCLKMAAKKGDVHGPDH